MSLLIGVPREVFPGEKRVATVPDVVEKLLKQGFRVAVEAGAGDAAQISDDAYRAAGAEVMADRAALWQAADIVFKVRAPDAAEIASMREGTVLVELRLARAEPGAHEGARRQGRHRARDGQRAAHLARAEVGRAVVDGEHRRLSRGDRGRPRVRALLHRFDHRGGQGPAGQGVRDRRRRGGARGHRHGFGSRRDRARERHASRGRRPDPLARRRVRARRLRGGRQRRRRLREGDERGLPEGAARRVRQAGEGRRHHHHDRAHPRQACAEAHHRGHGPLDEAGQRDRRHGGRAGRQLRAHGTRRSRRAAWRDDHRLQGPAEPPREAGVHAVRDQPAAPRRGPRQDEEHRGRAHRDRHGRRGAARHHGDQSRGSDMAATATEAVRGAGGSGRETSHDGRRSRRRRAATAWRAARCRRRRPQCCSAAARSCSC